MLRIVLRSARRQLHTFISKETIKPSSPTPSHLKTYNLSLSDQINPSVYMPIVFFYPNYYPASVTSSNHAKAAQLKKSLSKTLTQYYPFSGRLVAASDGAIVDCNDEGVDFLEYRTDTSLPKLAHLHSMDYQPPDQFFPAGTVWDLPSKGWGSLVMVQLTYFSCGGIALAVSMSHKLGDGCTLITFIDHWAAVTRGNSYLNDKVHDLPLHLISSTKTDFTSLQEYVIDKGTNCLTKKFVFPNSKLAQLKAKAKDHIMINPTRIEVLTSLLYICAVNAAKANSRDSVKGYILLQTVNLRKRMAQPLPENYVGNIYQGIILQTMHERELTLTSIAARIKNGKTQLRGVTNDQLNEWIIQTAEAFKNVKNRENDVEVYACTSVCGFPAYEVNFGWGKPIRMTIAGCPAKNVFLLMDTPNGDGIEALVALEEEDMAIFQKDEKLLAFSL